MANAASSKAIARAKAKARADEDIRRRTVQALMSHPDGRRFLWKMLEECNVFQQTFSSAPGGFALMSFAEGRRSVGLRLFADISRWAGNDFVKAMVENSTATIEEEDDGPESDLDASAYN